MCTRVVRLVFAQGVTWVRATSHATHEAVVWRGMVKHKANQIFDTTSHKQPQTSTTQTTKQPKQHKQPKLNSRSVNKGRIQLVNSHSTVLDAAAPRHVSFVKEFVCWRPWPPLRCECSHLQQSNKLCLLVFEFCLICLSCSIFRMFLFVFFFSHVIWKKLRKSSQSKDDVEIGLCACAVLSVGLFPSLPLKAIQNKTNKRNKPHKRKQTNKQTQISTSHIHNHHQQKTHNTDDTNTEPAHTIKQQQRRHWSLKLPPIAIAIARVRQHKCVRHCHHCVRNCDDAYRACFVATTWQCAWCCSWCSCWWWCCC